MLKVERRAQPTAQVQPGANSMPGHARRTSSSGLNLELDIGNGARPPAFMLPQQLATQTSPTIPYAPESHSGTLNCDQGPSPLPVQPLDENSLRRKTPSGTLVGAYQSSLGHSYRMKQCMPIASPPLPQPQMPFDFASVRYAPQHIASQYVNPLGQGPSTVVQHPHQPYGPTASGFDSRGLYGPYWHDGTFQPYRPHATRDPRYYHLGSQPIQPSGMPLPMLHLQQHRDPSMLRTFQPARHPLSQYVAADSAPSIHMRSPQPYVIPQSPQPIPPLPFSNPIELDVVSLTVQDRDRIFNLALQTYRELLGFLETVKKQKVQMSNGRSSKGPGIYPKPPSPSKYVSSEYFDSLSSSSTPVVSPGHYFPHASEHSSAVPQLYHEHNAALQHSAFQGQDSIDNARRLSLEAGTRYMRSPSVGNVHDAVSPPTSEVASFNTARHIAAQSTASIRAGNALRTLSKLCFQSTYQWIDGINLCGCLAYGLGDYQQALGLYSNVLQYEPKHIEAMSNLAATFLALNRKDDAEKHWRNVVSQAPSYFEAVEHLVGLLCANGRGKEAVKIVEQVEHALAMPCKDLRLADHLSDVSSLASRSPCISELSDKVTFDYDVHHEAKRRDSGNAEPGFGSSGYAIPGSDNGRMLALVHAKGNMMYSHGDNSGAARAFEDVVLIATARRYRSIRAVVQHVLDVITAPLTSDHGHSQHSPNHAADPVLLHPEQASLVAKLCFPTYGNLPGLAWLPLHNSTYARKGAMLTTSNSLLSLAKIYQDGMTSGRADGAATQLVSGVREILALYYLSLSLQPSPSTANNVGILLAGVQHSAPSSLMPRKPNPMEKCIPGVVPGSGIALALAYYNYGLLLDQKHAHLYTNLGSLLKDVGQLDAAIDMYKRAVACDGKFDIALANLANAVKDKGRVNEAIDYYHRAVAVNPDFAEAVCGLTNALNSVCRWQGRGGISGGKIDRWHVDEHGMLRDAFHPVVQSSGWMKRVVNIVEKQLADGERWGLGILNRSTIDNLVAQIVALEDNIGDDIDLRASIQSTLQAWAGSKYEGARLVRLVERLVRRTTWRWYIDRHVKGKEQPRLSYRRPQLPSTLTVPAAPTVLPFHTFTTPMSPKQVRLISQRNGYRISASTLKMPWLPSTVFSPPPKPSPVLKVGYLSSDFNNHPLAHLMQSVFGLHDRSRVECYCYATTASDGSVHRKQIERESPHFRDGSTWSTERIVQQIVADGIHILVNLNGYTRGARNEVFAARPAPIHMSFMGFAGTLGAEWSDYILADRTSVPPSTLRPWRRNVDIVDQLKDRNSDTDDCTTPGAESAAESDWVYGENIIFSRSTFFCCDHRQSAPDATSPRLSWEEEQNLRWRMRTELFPNLTPGTVILANFNQLYKIEPTTFRTWLRILSRVPNAILWLLRFPDLGEASLKRTAHMWAGPEVAARVVFTDVAPKHQHIARAKIVDLFLDTPECNAHTTAADVLWSGTPLLTYPRYEHKMCSRMAASILQGALPREPREERARAEAELIAASDDEYEDKAVALAKGLMYPCNAAAVGTTRGEAQADGGEAMGRGTGRLVELRRMLTEARWSSDLFDTRRWVADLEDAYEKAWRKWVRGEGGDIWLDEVPRGRSGPLP